MLIRKSLVSTITAATLLVAAQDPAAAQGAPSADSRGDITEVTVTARRREESILETPLSITAVTSADLEKKGITSFNQLVESTQDQLRQAQR